MAQIRLIVALFSFCCLVQSCNPDESDSVKDWGTVVLGEEGESYIKFEPGSYWIFKRKSDQQLDTITLISYTNRLTSFYGERHRFTREFIFFNWEGTYSGSYSFSNPALWGDGANPPVEKFSFECRRPTSTGSVFFYYPFTLEEYSTISGQHTKVVGIEPSYSIDDSTYSNVVIFDVDWDPAFEPFSYHHTKYYWAENIGLIKRASLDASNKESDSWVLVSYFKK